MSIIYMQMWLLLKDFPRDPWLSFPASSETVHQPGVSLSLDVLKNVVWLDHISLLLATLALGLLS